VKNAAESAAGGATGSSADALTDQAAKPLTTARVATQASDERRMGRQKCIDELDPRPSAHTENREKPLRTDTPRIPPGSLPRGATLLPRHRRKTGRRKKNCRPLAGAAAIESSSAQRPERPPRGRAAATADPSTRRQRRSLLVQSLCVTESPPLVTRNPSRRGACTHSAAGRLSPRPSPGNDRSETAEPVHDRTGVPCH
jgi:hypothetical protein